MLRIPVADKAIAQVALTELLTRVLATEKTTEPDPASMAEKLIEAASKVGFQSSHRRLVVGFDLGMTPEDEP
jgi:hypothetical protein